ncbi:hypothetical protein FB451DRAFT_92954 [Mycena latifolia]|nr:hypothetical protein FB451DRAFT_92954 [Mycena latifolia]
MALKLGIIQLSLGLASSSGTNRTEVLTRKNIKIILYPNLRCSSGVKRAGRYSHGFGILRSRKTQKIGRDAQSGKRWRKKRSKAG